MNLCRNCGKPLEDGAMFCTNCGSPVQAAASPSAVVTPITNSPAAAAPAVSRDYAGPNFSSPQSSSARSPMIFIIMVVVVLAGIGGSLFILGRIHSGSGEAQSSTAGSVPAGQSDNLLRSFNLGSYPGSTPAAISNESDENVIAAFQTRDTPEQVIGFYKVRFPVADTLGQEGQSELHATLANGERVVVRATKQASGTMVTIHHLK